MATIFVILSLIFTTHIVYSLKTTPFYIFLIHISGYKTEESFLKYIHVTIEQIAFRSANYLFFKGKAQ